MRRGLCPSCTARRMLWKWAQHRHPESLSSAATSATISVGATPPGHTAAHVARVLAVVPVPARGRPARQLPARRPRQHSSGSGAGRLLCLSSASNILARARSTRFLSAFRLLPLRDGVVFSDIVAPATAARFDGRIQSPESDPDRAMERRRRPAGKVRPPWAPTDLPREALLEGRGSLSPSRAVPGQKSGVAPATAFHTRRISTSLAASSTR